MSKTTYFRKGEWYISTSASYYIDKVDTGFGGLFEAEQDVQAITYSGAHKKLEDTS